MKVLHWNILADCNADNTETGFPFVDPEFLKWEHRFPLICQRLRAEAPDVVSLVEMDRPQDFVREFGQEYQTFLAPGKRIGILIMVKKPLEVLEHRIVVLPGNKILSLVRLPDFIFGSTHLKAKPEFSADRVQQVLKIQETLQEYSQPQILVGDFNDVPESDCIQQMTRTHKILSHPAFTTYKKRKKMVTRTIDYIFGSEGPAGPDAPERHDGPKIEIDPTVGLPNQNFPSDHVYLMLEFS